MVKVRAYENRAFYMAVNRVGTERGVRFDGGSMVADPEGDLVLEAGAEAGRFHVEIDLARAAVSREVVRPGEYELDLIEDRQPGTYEAITRPLVSPRRTGSQGSGEPAPV
jgi:predicted amidohydrolase